MTIPCGVLLHQITETHANSRWTVRLDSYVQFTLDGVDDLTAQEWTMPVPAWIERASRVALKVAWWWFAIGCALAIVLNGPHQFGRLFSYRDPEAAGALSAYVLVAAVLRWTHPLLWPKDTRRDGG